MADLQGRSKTAERSRSAAKASEGAADPREERGVHNPRVVDLIRLDPAADEVELLLIERRAWSSDPAQLRQLEAKFNAYLGYVQAGALARDYPEYAGRRVRFRLECATPPEGAVARMLDAMRSFAAQEGIRFVAAPGGSGPAPG